MSDNNGSAETCGVCHWYTKRPMGMIISTDELGFCFASPPQCTNGMIGGKSVSFSGRPTVKPDDKACSLFHRPPKVVDNA